jgi:L,D-transpeptidase catalytic domain
MSTPRRHISQLRPSGVDRRSYKPGAGGFSPLSERSVHRAGRDDGGAGPTGPRLRRSHRLILGVFLVAVVVLVGVGLAFVLVGASLSTSPTALANVGMPLGGGKIERVSVVTGPHSRPIPVRLSGADVWPRVVLPVGEQVSVEAVVKRPSWISWLTGDTEHVRLNLTTPSARLRDQYLTLAAGAPLRLHFEPAVAAVSYGDQAPLHRRTLTTAQEEVTVPRGGPAGSLLVAATPRTWESTTPSAVSYFPPGAHAAAVANPAPGSQIGPATSITLTFSEPVDKALGDARPVLSPSTDGSWVQTSEHTLVFRPRGYGYGLGSTVTVALPNGVRLVAGQSDAHAATASWTVPHGSTLRLQQLLAQLGYLPVSFHEHGASVALTPEAEQTAAVNPPAGSFHWRYGSVPSALHGFWQPGSFGELTRGAVMALENRHEMTADGEAGPAVWRALIADAIAHRTYSFGYTFADVNEGSQSLSIWHDGHTVMTTLVNTGIASRPTETGTFAVYEHISSGTMSGTNPDGSHYEDPGVPWISYFNGGDALHGFERAQYGLPQSLGCVEMPVGTAGQVWPYTPVGTIVNVHS